LGLLEKIEDHTLKVPRGDRSGVVIEPWLTLQWYVDAKKLAGPAIDAVESGAIEFVPKQWENTYFAWMRDIQDWCISRQLWWGHRIPAWYDEDGNVYVGEDEAAVRREYNLDDDKALRQDDDVLDTWFSSALWTFSTLGWPEEAEELAKFHPASVLVTGFDIIFFWVARMIMMTLHLKGEVPFKQVYVHGLVRDGEGQKMSKSKGNVLDPIDLIDGIDLESLAAKRTSSMMQPKQAQKVEKATRKQFPDGIPGYGTDALRFTFYSLASTGRDIKFDLGRMEGFRNFCNKLWNASRYVLMNTEGFAPDLETPAFSLADRWIHSRLQTAIAETSRSIEQYRFDHAAQTLYDFVWNEYCDWYLELSKPVLWNDGASASEKHGTLLTLLNVLETVLRLLHPMMPFITEEIWQSVAPRLGRQGDTIMLAAWPTSDAEQSDTTAEDEIEWLKTVISAVRTIRSEANIAPSETLEVLLGNATSRDAANLEKHLPSLQKLAKVGSAKVLTETDEEPPVLSALAGTLEVMVPMAGVIDINNELSRLDKELERMTADQARTFAKLANKNFVDRAPEAVVAKEKMKLKELEAGISSLRAQKSKIEQLR